MKNNGLTKENIMKKAMDHSVTTSDFSIGIKLSVLEEILSDLEKQTIKNTTIKEMKKICCGETFVINGVEHIASTDAHMSGDSSCEEYIVYDENGEGWFETDFEEKIFKENIDNEDLEIDSF